MNKYNVPQAILKGLIATPFLNLFNQPAMDCYFLAIHRSLKWLAMKLQFRRYGLT